MSKVTVIGAGAVGATCANVLTVSQIASEVVLLDVREGFAEGKAMDIMQTQPALGFATKISGVTNDYKATANSDIVVITSGVPRKPGMTREELIGTNAGIVNDVVSKIMQFSPQTILIIVTNPMDTMTYLALKTSGLPKNKVIGMGSSLDSSRFTYFLSQVLKMNAQNISAMVIGGHGDTTMIPLKRFANCKGKPVSELLSATVLDQVANDTMVGGATLTKLLGTSAWMAPGASAAMVVKAILNNEKIMMPCCVALNGEYGHEDVCIGAPVILGKEGWEEIVSLKLNDEEKDLFDKSVAAVRSTNDVLKEMNLV